MPWGIFHNFARTSVVLTRQHMALGLMGIMLATGLSLFAAESSSEPESLFNLSLEELMTVVVEQPVTLTSSRKRSIPGALTRISQADIASSGARSLDDLLRIYVPGLQTMSKINGGDQLGIRGIISDRNNKFLLLVDGRVMNEKTTFGAITERDLSMLGDIHHIDVIRGPGGVIYGPGAIAGVINIVTHTARTFDGMEVQIRQGGIENFSNMELRLGHTFVNESRLFAYYGVDDYRGADGDDAPHIFSSNFTAGDGSSVVEGSPLAVNLPNDNRAYRGQLRHKAQLTYEIDDLRLSLRYTRGGKYMMPSQVNIAAADPTQYNNRSYGYQQLTATGDYKWELDDSLWIDFRLSFDMLDAETERGNIPVSAYREDEYYGRIMGHWRPNETHQFALGTEVSYERFGLRSPGYPELAPIVPPIAGTVTPWDSYTISAIGEYQWAISPTVTAFAGARVDHNNYTSDLLSSRVALVYSPTARDTLKLVYNRASRRPDESTLRNLDILGNDTSMSETLDFVELRYERQLAAAWWSGLSTFYGDYDIIAWNGTAQNVLPIGNLTYYGIEAELSYKTERTTIALAHSFVKHLNFENAVPGTTTNVSASDLGYGDDLANWSNQQTTISARRNLTAKLTGTMSLGILWGFPGAEDLADYNRDNGNLSNLPIANGSDRAFEESIFLNGGLSYKASDAVTLRFDAYNMMGWFDKDYNKENEFQRTSHYQSKAPAVALTLTYRF